MTTLTTLIPLPLQEAQPLATPKVSQPKVIGALLAPIAALIAGAMLAIPMVLIAMSAAMALGLGASLRDSIVLLAALLSGQMGLLFTALFAAFRSPEPMRDRLGLTNVSIPRWGLPFVALSGLAIQLGVGTIAQTIGLPVPAALIQVFATLRSSSPAVMIVGGLVMGVLPGVTEELLMRGYVQRRLARRWGPAIGIVASSAMFSLLHLDPVHITCTLLFSLWLGWVAFRTGSTLPAVLIHVCNNSALVILWAVTADDSGVDTSSTWPWAAILIPAAAMLTIAIVAVRRSGRGMPAA